MHGPVRALVTTFQNGDFMCNFRRDIGRRLIAKTGHIIKKFVVEIEDAEKDFRIKSENPPVAENLPPISGFNSG